MNPPSPESPRLVCRVVRWWAALTDSSAPAPGDGPTTGHRARCPACRAYFDSNAALETHLRQAARAHGSAAPAGLERSIADAVRRAQGSAIAPGQAAARVPQRRAVPFWATGLATAAAVVALVVLLNRETAQTSATAEVEPTEIAAVFSAVTTLPAQLNKVLAPADARPSVPDPLRRELDNVRADARSALSFLAENFLPAVRPDPSSTLRDRRSTVQGG